VPISCSRRKREIGDAPISEFIPAAATAVLPRLVPLNTAMYLLFTGKTLPAADFKALGLVSEVHPKADLVKPHSGWPPRSR
jgi:enoyl-CoA hydratase/carnithine racemase